MNKTLTFPVNAKSADKGTGQYSVWISTEDIDRSGDIVRAAGVKLDNYLKNPAVMYGHDYSIPPIAKATALDILPGKGIKATFKFPSEGIHPLADTIRGLWSEGFINAASIGFNPIKSVNLDPNRPYGPQEYTEVELLEFSLVGIPANQSALRLAYQKTLRASGKKDPGIQSLEIAKLAIYNGILDGRRDSKYFKIAAAAMDLFAALAGIKLKK